MSFLPGLPTSKGQSSAPKAEGTDTEHAADIMSLDQSGYTQQSTELSAELQGSLKAKWELEADFGAQEVEDNARADDNYQTVLPQASSPSAAPEYRYVSVHLLYSYSDCALEQCKLLCHILQFRC